MSVHTENDAQEHSKKPGKDFTEFGRSQNIMILKDSTGNPAFAIVPFSDWQAIIQGKDKLDKLIPSEVVDYALDNDVSATCAWRKYLDLTQADVAKRLGISQAAYSKMEGRKTLRKTSREKVALALGILQEQLDF